MSGRPRIPYTWLTAPVRVSSRLSCGCAFRPSETMPAAEARTLPGTVVICNRHDEWAVVTRVSVHLETTTEVLTDLLRPVVDDDLTAQCVAAEQSSR